MGLKIGLTYDETVNRTQGELMDIISCYAIANGAREKIKYTFDEVMRVR